MAIEVFNRYEHKFRLNKEQFDEIVKVLDDSGVFITLIKPQFECGRHALGKGGIVKDKK